jgi:hypothetical protein
MDEGNARRQPLQGGPAGRLPIQAPRQIFALKSLLRAAVIHRRRKKMPKPVFLQVFLAATLAFVLACPELRAEYAWHEDVGSVYYGEKDNPEDIALMFSCEETGKVTLLVARAENKLKPNKKISLLLATQQVQSRLNAETTANEMDADVSISASLTADDPIFASMVSSKNLTISSESWSASYKISGSEAGEMISQFQADCKTRR